MHAGDARLALGVGWFLGILGDLPDECGVVDRDAVHGRADHEFASERRAARSVEQIGEEDVVDGQRHRLGERAVEIAVAGCHPCLRIGDPAFGEAVLHPLGDVVEARPAALKQRVEVFQCAGVAADVAVGALAIVVGESIEAGELPDQLGGLSRRQRPEV